VKPARLRPRAKSDLSDQAWYYAQEVGRALADRFVDEALFALDTIGRHPGIGSPRWNRPGASPVLRAWRVGRFPMVWFYFEHEDLLDVVRLLGERQDIPAILESDPV
jgi:toxin ParE1/3/4